MKTHDTTNTKKELTKKPPNIIKKILQIILYISIQILFIPLAIIGLILGIYKGIIQSKKMGISFSACRALQYKWFLHYFDVRSDPFSVAFIKKFPCESHFGLLAIFGALIIAHRWFGFTTKFGEVDAPGEETFLSFAGPRVLMFDKIMEKYMDGMEQIVIPGAGFDLIAMQHTKGKDINVFELDQSRTIDVKTKTLKKTNIKHDWITYIPVDYSNESWVDKLIDAGFDTTKKTLFLWQSVSLFLEIDEVKKTLREMADLCIEGSIIAQDIYSKAFISGEASKAVKRASRMIEQREPWIFGLEMSHNPKGAVESFLKECGLKIIEYNQFGEKLDLEPFYCIIESEKL